MTPRSNELTAKFNKRSGRRGRSVKIKVSAVLFSINRIQYGHAAIMKNSELNGCYASHIIIHSGTHVVKVPDHLQDRIASPINCALATMISAVSGLNGRGSNRETIALIQVI